MNRTEKFYRTRRLKGEELGASQNKPQDLRQQPEENQDSCLWDREGELNSSEGTQIANTAQEWKKLNQQCGVS